MTCIDCGGGYAPIGQPRCRECALIAAGPTRDLPLPVTSPPLTKPNSCAHLLRGTSPTCPTCGDTRARPASALEVAALRSLRLAVRQHLDALHSPGISRATLLDRERAVDQACQQAELAR